MPENSKQDVSHALALHGEVAALLEAVAGCEGGSFAGAEVPAASVSGDVLCCLSSHTSLFCCCYLGLAQGGMGRWEVCWREGTAREVFVGRQWGPSKAPPAAAHPGCDTKT